MSWNASSGSAGRTSMLSAWWIASRPAGAGGIGRTLAQARRAGVSWLAGQYHRRTARAHELEAPMATTGRDLRDVLVGDPEHWQDGPPNELFKQLRAECPVHWTSRIPDFPNEAGYWSVTTADDVHTVSRDWQTYSSELGGITALTDSILPLELTRAMFIGMDPPKHDRLKALFQAGFTPRRIAEHEDAIRAITAEVLDGLDGRETCDLVTDVAQPVVARVIGSFMGIPPEDDAVWAGLMNAIFSAGDPDMNPEGVETVMSRDVPEVFERCRALIAERRTRP